MARADAHTRVVGWLKVALPLIALALLATLFLLADRIDPDDALPYAEVDV
jgi:lipopolysaccharide export system protein LptC